MKMVLTSGVFSIVIGVVAYYILINMGMDSANVMSSINVRLQYLKSTKRIKKNDKNKIYFLYFHSKYFIFNV